MIFLVNCAQALVFIRILVQHFGDGEENCEKDCERDQNERVQNDGCPHLKSIFCAPRLFIFIADVERKGFR